MEGLNTFLQKFKKFDVPDRDIREWVVRLCAQEFKTKLPLSAVTVKKDVVYVDVAPLVKGEFLLRKDDLLRRLNTDFSARKTPIKDIR